MKLNLSGCRPGVASSPALRRLSLVSRSRRRRRLGRRENRVPCKALEGDDDERQEQEEEERERAGGGVHDWVGSEDSPLLNRDREGYRVSDYIGGKEWLKHRKMYPRVFDSTEDLKEAIFPENFYGTQLQRQIFPEDVGNRAYVEYDTLPPYEGDVTHRAEDAEELLNSGRVEDKEVEFWFRNADMPDSGFPLKIECDKLQDYVPEEYDMQASFNDVFTPFCPTVKDAPPAKEGLGIEQEIRGKVIGAHIQHGVLVDLGFNIAGLIPMYHQQDEKGLSSKCFETLGIQKFEEFFGPDKEVLVKVHALRFQQYASEDTYVYRFPIELELLEPGLDPETLAKPLDRLDGDSEAPIVLRDPRRRDLWEEMVQVTGRTLDDEFLDQLDSIASEFEMARKEQYDSINDMEIFDPNNDDFNKKRGSADPLWGIRNLAPKN